MTPASVEPDEGSSSRRVVSEYKVFWNCMQSKRLLLLQFPSKPNDKPFNAARKSKPLEIRVKPLSGLLEIDIPIYLDARYNSERGLSFSQALRQSKTLQTGGEFGLPGGFGINAQARQNRPTNPARKEETDGHLNGTRALTRLTMGGRLQLFGSDDPTYAIGVFKGKELHLSKVDGICSLQPQFHHLDAAADNERYATRVGGAEYQAVESEARAVNMSVKSTEIEANDMGETDRTLRTMQEEAWQRLEWIDEADARAYTALDDELVMANTENLTTLVSAMTERQYLDAISAPRIDPFRQGKRVIINRPWSDDGREGVLEEEETSGDVSVQRVTGAGSKSAPIKLKLESE